MHLGKIAAEQPGKPAVIMAGSGQTITFAELNAAANRLGHVLHDAGLRPGDHIAFMLENRWEFLAIAWAAQRSGLYYTAISPRLQPDELAYIVDDCGAQVLIASRAVADLAAALTAGTPRVRLRLMLDAVAERFTSYEEATGAAPDTPLADEVEGSDMLYSSGTTGRPKGVKPDLPLDPMGTPNSLYQLVSALFPPDADAVYLSPAPLYHAAPMRYCLTMHRFGATVVVMEKFDPEHALAAIETYRVTHSQWVPTMGDVGYVDEDGFLYLTDRLSYMIISGGVNVYPQEAENVLAVHPEVADVAVFGIPDPDMGEQVKAVVQPVSMLDAGPELAAELIAYCRSRLTHHKCPRTIDFRADLPRHPTGKLLKRVIRDEYLRETFS